MSLKPCFHTEQWEKQQLDSGGERTKQYEQSAGDMLSAVRRINLSVEEQQGEDGCLRVFFAAKKPWPWQHLENIQLGWLSYSFIGAVHYHHGREGQMCWSWECCSPRSQEVSWDTILIIVNLTSSNKALPSETKPHLLVVPLPVRIWGPSTFKLQQ